MGNSRIFQALRLYNSLNNVKSKRIGSRSVLIPIVKIDNLAQWQLGGAVIDFLLAARRGEYHVTVSLIYCKELFGLFIRKKETIT